MQEFEIRAELEGMIAELRLGPPGYQDCNKRLLGRLESALAEYAARYEDDSSSGESEA